MTAAQSGWYPNPENPAQQRYWDGAQWTDHAILAALPPGAPGASEQLMAQSPQVAAVGSAVRNATSCFSIVFVLFWAVLWLGGSASLLLPKHTDNAVMTTGIIDSTSPVWVSGSRNRGGSWGCEAFATFEANGQSYQVGVPAQRPCPWSPGDTIPVEYNSADPSDAMVPSPPPPVWLYAMPLIGIALPALVIWRTIKVQRALRT